MEEYPDTGGIDYKSVLETDEHDTYDVVYLTIDGEEFTTTEGHPFYTHERGFVKAGELRFSDTLIDDDDNKLHLEKKNKGHLVNPVTVYNFAVEDYHNYFVGENEVLVHNMCVVSGESNPATVTAGNNFKDHFIRHKKLLENITGNSYPKFKTHGQAFLNDISSVINNGIVKYDGIGTLKKVLMQ